MGRRRYTLKDCNDRLAAARVGLKILQRGERLSLRGTLPPKPGAQSKRPSQQTISLGVMASPAGFEYAEAKALEYGALLAQKRFDWAAIDRPESGGDSCEAWVESFKASWQRDQSGTDEEIDLKWREQFWYPAFSKLPQSRTLTADLLHRTLQRWKDGTRSRQVAAQKLMRLARFASIECDLDTGGYSPRDVQRDIPDDDVIVNAIDGIKNDKWQWIAGMMATYGLRDHEAFLCTLETMQFGSESIIVASVPANTKTGARVAFPIPAEWVERWQLTHVRRPAITAKSNKIYGDRTSTQFQRMKMPFRPYELRHAWSVRSSLQYGLATAVSAQFMGHDPNTNLGIYQKHISLHQSAQAYVEAMKRKSN